MREHKPAMLTYDDNPHPHIDAGVTWSEFLKSLADFEKNGWPKPSDTEQKPIEIVMSEEQIKKLQEYVAAGMAEPAVIHSINLTDADIMAHLQPKPRRIIRLRNQLRAYLTERFKRDSHPKYHRYCDEWINHTTINQLRYFEMEKQRIESGVVLR